MHTSDPSFSGLIGAATADITPPVGIYNRNWGAAIRDTAVGIHRPLTVTALSLQTAQGETPHVIVGIDLGWWRTQEDEFYLRNAVIAECGLEHDHLLINLCHTHAGPSTFRQGLGRPGEDLVIPYMDYVRSQTIGAVRAAIADSHPATVSWAYGKCDLAQNRDLPDPAHDRFVCGWYPSAEADDTLLVGRVRSDSGALIATVVNYACHPVTLAWDNDLISPDWVGAMRETIGRDTDGAPCLFLQGASGELAPREEYVGNTDIADANGRKVGYAALATLAAMLPSGVKLEYDGVVESGTPLGIWSRKQTDVAGNLSSKRIDVALPLKPSDTRQEIQAQILACGDRVQSERLLRKLHVKRNVGDSDHTTVPLWVWRIGDMSLVAQQNEAYSDLQTTLRDRFPGQAIAVLGLVNGGCGYLPPKQLYDCEVYQVFQTPFAEGSLEILIDAAIDALTCHQPSPAAV